MNSPAHASSPTPSRRCRLKALALLLFTLLLGVIIGIGSSAFLLRSHLQATLRDPSVANAPIRNFLSHTEAKLTSDLKSTPGERSSIHRELEQTGDQLGVIRANTTREIKALALDTITRIEQQLPPEKRPLFHQLAINHLKPWGVTGD
jgi:hypothetical protein